MSNTARPDVRAVIALQFQLRQESVEDWLKDWTPLQPTDPIDAVTQGSLEEMLRGLRQLFSDVTPYGTVILPDGTVREWDETGLLPPVE